MRNTTQRIAGGGLLLGLGVAMAGCSAAATSNTTHMQELDNAVQSSYATSHPDRLYYIGSDGQYDYYYLQNENRKYKVSQGESLREPRMKVTDDRSQWQIVPGSAMEPDSKD